MVFDSRNTMCWPDFYIDSVYLNWIVYWGWNHNRSLITIFVGDFWFVGDSWAQFLIIGRHYKEDNINALV